MRRAVPLALLTLAVGGCGGSDGESPSEAYERGAAPEVQTAAPSTAERTAPSANEPSADEQQIRSVADRYADAYARQDWAGVCETLTPEARAKIEGAVGAVGVGESCEDGLALAGTGDRERDRPDLSKLVVTGDSAEAPDAVPDRGDGSTTARFRRVDGQWLLQADDGS